jgi:hypothetical protein
MTSAGRCRGLVLTLAIGAAVLPVALAAADARPPTQPGHLPEDPVKGAAATAQWRAHMAAEERERKLHYDRDRMKDHRAVLSFLLATRARYERAPSRAAVLALRARLPPAIEKMRGRITRIDHWRVSSNLLGDYDVMLAQLGDAYPAARISYLDGDPAPLLALRADFDRRRKAIEDWLAEAAESEDE